MSRPTSRAARQAANVCTRLCPDVEPPGCPYAPGQCTTALSRTRTLYDGRIVPDTRPPRLERDETTEVVDEIFELGSYEPVEVITRCRHVNLVPVISVAGEHVSDICLDCPVTLYVEPDGSHAPEPLRFRTPTYDYVRH